MNLHPMGEAALLVDTASPAHAQALRHALLASAMPGLRELVPGQASLLIVIDPAALGLDELAQRVTTLTAEARAAAPRHHEFITQYSGEDLTAVARLSGMEPVEVVRRHAATSYEVAFLGFAPGFAYLTGLDPALRLPRRAEPRTRVPAGSVAIADEFTGIYPQASPGGWHILGGCDVRLFDTSLTQPALLSPGDQVRFTVAR
ncbi:MAG TPA: allophanate hydrolase subunit 1 [Gammaproteobacteria bacterium]|nr:allophanate hydrolase subunit 1 [Gammaproteobacteria bacterium]